MDSINNNLDNKVVDNEKIKSDNLIGIYNKDDNGFVSIKINEGRNIDNVKKKLSIFDACKKLRDYEKSNKVNYNERLTSSFILDENISVKAKGITDEQIYERLNKYEKEKLNIEKHEDSFLDICEKLSHFEAIYKIPYADRLTHTYDLDRQIYRPNDGVENEQIINRLEFFEKISEVLNNLIKDDKLIEKFMIIINTKGIEEAYIDDESHKGVTEGAVQFLSRQEQIEKIMSTLVTFKDPIIVNSKGELEKLQAEYREAHWEKLVHRSEEKEVVRDKKAELLKLMNEQKTRGYIRISNEDYIEIKNQIEEMGITYIAKESGNKLGMNIVVPVNEMNELKDLLHKNEIKILQEVEGNTDWFKFKKAEDINTHDISSETLKSFQNLNSDKFKYIAFENDGKYSIYTEPGCTVEIKDEKIKYNEDCKNHEKKTLKEVTKKKDEYKKSKEEVTTKVNEKNNSRGER